MSALRPAFFILYLESYISRLNEILRHDLTLSVSEPDNAAAQIGAGTAFGVNGGQHTRAAELSTYFCVLTIRKHLLMKRFERSANYSSDIVDLYFSVQFRKRFLNQLCNRFCIFHAG